MPRIEPRKRRPVSILDVFRPLKAGWRSATVADPAVAQRRASVLKPFDFHRKAPPQNFQQLLIRVGMLGMAAFALGGIVMIFWAYGKTNKPTEWGWEYRDIRRNFMPIYSTEENDKRFKEELNKSTEAFRFESETPGNKPATNEGTRLPGETGEAPKNPPDAPPPGDPAIERDAREVKLAAELTLGPWVKIEDEVVSIPTYSALQDWRPQYRSQLKSEFDANKGRQAPPYEQLSLQILRKVPAPGKPERSGYESKLEKGKFWFGVGKEAVNFYRGRVFEAEGRLFDIYEVKLDPPAVLSDGTKFDHYFEAVVAFLREGKGHQELPIVQQQVLVNLLECPDALKPFLNTKGAVSQEDALSQQEVFVKFTGVYLRNFIYNREVAPFHAESKPVLCQSFLPLLLSADVELSKHESYALTDQLLQQVRDSTSDDINFVQDEAAYYATLAQANRKDDKLKVVPEINYFDLANLETGPKYRGQGIHVYGMLGDNYAPVILPPNISGLRRVYRLYVAASVLDLNTPNRWLVDMIDLPKGLEARVAVKFEGRYYRNVFETQNNNSLIRPLLIVHHVERHYTSDTSQDWIFALVIISGAIIMFGGFVWFMLSDRRAASRFEQQNMARLRERVEKQGGLKLKPLPGKEPEAIPPMPQTPAPPDAAPPQAPSV
jgi:hypothetical protein